MGPSWGSFSAPQAHPVCLGRARRPYVWFERERGVGDRADSSQDGDGKENVTVPSLTAYTASLPSTGKWGEGGMTSDR